MAQNQVVNRSCESADEDTRLENSDDEVTERTLRLAGEKGGSRSSIGTSILIGEPPASARRVYNAKSFLIPRAPPLSRFART